MLRPGSETAGQGRGERASPVTELIAFEQVGLRYDAGEEVLCDLDFALSEGSFQFVTGGSGAGKSSLLSLIGLARLPTRGRMRMFGETVSDLSRERRTRLRRAIGIVFQDFRLIDHLSVVDNVALPLRVAGAWTPERMKDVIEVLRWVGLGARLKATPPVLSGGEQQRVAIARAEITKPSILLADEPTGNVDDQIGFRLVHLFEQMNRLGTTVVIATHNEKLIARFPHPVIALDRGHARLMRAAQPAAKQTDPTPAEARAKAAKAQPRAVRKTAVGGAM